MGVVYLHLLVLVALQGRKGDATQDCGLLKAGPGRIYSSLTRAVGSRVRSLQVGGLGASFLINWQKPSLVSWHMDHSTGQGMRERSIFIT